MFQTTTSSGMGKVAMIKDFYLGIEVWINLAQHKVQVCFECFGVQFSILGVPPETLVKHVPPVAWPHGQTFCRFSSCVETSSDTFCSSLLPEGAKLRSFMVKNWFDICQMWIVSEGIIRFMCSKWTKTVLTDDHVCPTHSTSKVTRSYCQKHK